MSDKLTIYIGARNNRGEVIGLLIDDERDSRHPVTLIAERGAFAESGNGSRIIMVNGNRQQYDRDTGKLSVLTFDRYTPRPPDAAATRRALRFREPQERFLGELTFLPPRYGDAATRAKDFWSRAEPAHALESADRIQLCDDPACLPASRRVQPARPVAGAMLQCSSTRRLRAVAFQASSISAVKNLAGRYSMAIVLSCDIIRFCCRSRSDRIILHRGMGSNSSGGFRWRPPRRSRAITARSATGGLVHVDSFGRLWNFISAYIARQFFTTWGLLRRLRHDAAFSVSFLLDYIELLRRGAS